ncbi:CBM35 domain-containing protein [Acrocarpospora catenulata]|uniref:CBM35 domain-containing protein n=1 Tax=Acrocarpospora catenulata TaxID=2836182 RepID=UPI001BD913C0|nr:CBM35 domain-containing protein [Acrocarpospora catenulata]
MRGHAITGALLLVAGILVSGSSAAGAATPFERGTRYEAESATIVQGRVERSRRGYSGEGYVNGSNRSGSYVEWTVSAETAGEAKILIRYANPGRRGTWADISVNGQTVAEDQRFRGTRWWRFWRTLSFRTPLVAGANTIRITATTRRGNPHLDHLEVRDLPAPPTESPTPTPTPPGECPPTTAPPTETPPAETPTTPTATPSVTPPVETPPVDTPTVTPPVDTPTVTPPVDTPTVTPPVDTPTVTPPVETPPAETPCVEPPCVVETPPVETPPVETPTSAPTETPTATPPVETPPAESASPLGLGGTPSPGATPPADSATATPPVESPTVTPPVETPPVETPPAETPPTCPPPSDDTEPPTTPGQPVCSDIGSTELTLDWPVSTDNIGAVAYDIFHDGTLIASVEAPPVRIVGLPPATDYSLTVVARDAAGNFSASSPAVECATLAEGS